jgi:hypothetical protein
LAPVLVVGFVRVRRSDRDTSRSIGKIRAARRSKTTMKKIIKPRPTKLVLSTETVRPLSTDQLKHAVGGQDSSISANKASHTSM